MSSPTPNIRGTLTPTLVLGAGHDRVVPLRAVERFATRLKVGRLIVIPDSKHEIMMERDYIRTQFWAAFDAFRASISPSPHSKRQRKPNCALCSRRLWFWRRQVA